MRASICTLLKWEHIHCSYACMWAYILPKCEHAYCSNEGMHITSIKHVYVNCSNESMWITQMRALTLLKFDHAYCSNESMHIAQV